MSVKVSADSSPLLYLSHGALLEVADGSRRDKTSRTVSETQRHTASGPREEIVPERVETPDGSSGRDCGEALEKLTQGQATSIVTLPEVLASCKPAICDTASSQSATPHSNTITPPPIGPANTASSSTRVVTSTVHTQWNLLCGSTNLGASQEASPVTLFPALVNVHLLSAVRESPWIRTQMRRSSGRCCLSDQCWC
ncbi:hypothetical protein DNTS_005924 [Danionella cerebrum]|uniref:Uncharacterized protein n=1 Tax=Danionella cerebrum TaxID=2873325 RepID=A0A553NIW6_9TELE|nr:hypothetical protein DNTS_005924 [Danionella translucida]